MNCKERLTIKVDGAFVPKELCITDKNGDIDGCDNCKNICNNTCGDCDICPIQKCFDRLGELEDKLENGTLIEVDENYHTHICKAKGLVNGFSIFARVVDETDDTVTIERYQEFGALKIRNIMISKEDFERYYKKISEVQCFLPKKKPKQG